MGTTSEVLKKLRGLDPPKLLAIVDGFGGRKNLEAWLRGEKMMTLKDVIRKLIDHTGRSIPTHLDVTSAFCDENPDFFISQSIINYAVILDRFIKFFPTGTCFLSAAKFEERARAAKNLLLSNDLVANLFKRPAWPLPLPWYEVKDEGRSMRYFFLPAVKEAYENQFPGNKFIVRCGEEMEGKIISLPEYNGHDRLIAKMAEGPAMAWYFPNPMQGFSVLAQREAGKILLQHDLLLNGAIEPALALVGFTAEMARDFHTPGYDCPAVSWQSTDWSLDFRATDHIFEIRPTRYLGNPQAADSGALLFLG